MTDGVDTAVEQDELAARQSTPHHLRRDPNRRELPPRHYTVLAICQNRQRPVRMRVKLVLLSSSNFTRIG